MTIQSKSMNIFAHTQIAFRAEKSSVSGNRLPIVLLTNLSAYPSMQKK